jgi:hypothetical protein
VLGETPHWQKLLTLAPVFVVGAGLVLAVLILLGRAFAASVRESGHQRLIVVAAIALTGLVVLLTYLGVELPKEG